MTSSRVQVIDQGTNNLEPLSLCSIGSARERFGIETTQVLEVLDKRHVRRIPLAPAYIGGLIPYRGEVVTTISLRALLGRSESTSEASVLVLEDSEQRERFGLLVDSIDGVKTVSREVFERNPCTLDPRLDAIFSGAYKLKDGLLIHLDPCKISPSSLSRISLQFERVKQEGRCEY